jgi:hypothetical protein
MKKTLLTLIYCLISSYQFTPSLNAEELSINEWETLLKELHKIEAIARDTTTLQFKQGCTQIEEYKNDKGETLSHRFNCLGKKIAVVYQGTFAIVFLEDKEEVRIIDLSLAKNEISMKNMVVHFLSSFNDGLSNPLANTLEADILPAVANNVFVKQTIFHTAQSVKKVHFKHRPLKFSMNEFSSVYRDSDLTRGEDVGKLALVIEKDKIDIAPRNTIGNNTKAITLSFFPIIGSYFSSFYMQVERGDMFHAGKTLKLIDDLINSHPDELGFLKGHSQEDRDKSFLLFKEIAETSGIDPEKLQAKLDKIQEKRIDTKMSSSSAFYQELHKTDRAIRKRQYDEDQTKDKGFFGKIGYKTKKLFTNNDSHYTGADVFEDYIDKYGRAPLQRVNPIFNFMSLGNLFRDEAVHAGYMAETYYRQNEKDLYNKARAMPKKGDKSLPSFDEARASIRNAQAIFAKNLCPNLDDQSSLTNSEQHQLKDVQDSINELEGLFFTRGKSSWNKNSGLTEDYDQATRALEGRPNYEKAMTFLASGMRKLELSAAKILALQNELSELSPTSPKYQAEHLRLTKLMAEWGHWNGLIRQKIDMVMSQNLKLAQQKKKPTDLPVDLAYLYQSNPHAQDLSPGGPKESYLELNRWFAQSSDFAGQISNSLSKGVVEIAPPAKLVEAPYRPDYKVYEKSNENDNLIAEKYKSKFTVEQYHQFQQNAERTYQQHSKKSQPATQSKKPRKFSGPRR